MKEHTVIIIKMFLFIEFILQIDRLKRTEEFNWNESLQKTEGWYRKAQAILVIDLSVFFGGVGS